MGGRRGRGGGGGHRSSEGVGARAARDVNGIWGGYTGEGAKTVLPAVATAKLSTRLVADQDWREIGVMLRAYVEQTGPGGIAWEVRDRGRGPGGVTDRLLEDIGAAGGQRKQATGRGRGAMTRWSRSVSGASR